MGFRRFLARAALVDEERDRRNEQVAAAEARLAARQEREMHPMRDEISRMLRDNAAILRLLSADDGRSGPTEQAPVGSTFGRSLRSLFTEIERGSREEVMGKVETYLPLFAVAGGPVVDLGCGRGEFLELARREGLEAYGIDSDRDSVEGCRALGLDARQEDLFEHLASVSEGSLGGVFSAQVVEHLPAERLPELFALASRALRPEGLVVIETPNPATFATHVQSFWRDPTHVRPVPAAALGFAARTAGLVVEGVRFSSLPPEEDRLQPIYEPPADPEARRIVEAFNAMTQRLNELLYGYQDYTLVGRKPA